MNYDYFVELSQRSRRDLQDTDYVTVKYHHLVATEPKGVADDLRADWADARLDHEDIDTSDLALCSHVAVPTVDINIFPPYTLFLQFPFRLTKSYLSKDERAFYIVDNPVRRDRVFRLPYVASASWKGSLRAALWKQGYDETHRSTRRLFGNEKGAEEDFRAGRLHFFPTFFKQHSLEIINPHDRNRKVGKNPILFESTPAGTIGVFSLLYVPFDRIGLDDAETRREVAEDLELLADGVHAMLCIYGFGAKASSGYGAAVESFVGKRDRMREGFPEGKVQLKAILGEPEEVRSFQEAYGRLDAFTPDEWQVLLEDDKKLRTAYKDARAAHRRHRQNIQTHQVSQEIENFNDMAKVLKTWAHALQKEESSD